jgi:hypothetical protein
MATHYKYGGSTAARTMACPAWHHLSADMPRSPSSPAAALGTALHEIIEKCLLDVDIDPFDFSGTEVEGVKITDDHILEKIYPALDAFEVLMDKYDIQEFSAEKTYVINKDVGGTTDFVGWSGDRKTIVMADYKSGDGIMVDATENKQNQFYAMCAKYDENGVEELFDNHVKIASAIIQPSHRRDDVLDIWETTVPALDAFTQAHEKAVVIATSGDSEPVTGSHCAFCPAEATCPAKLNLVETIDGYEIDKLKLEQVASALAIADEIETWVKAVRKFAHESIERGIEIEGYKLVAKRATRKWLDEKKVLKALTKDKLYKKAELHKTPVFLSPAQIEKIVSPTDWETLNISDMYQAISTGTTLALASDPRTAVGTSKAAALLADRFQ